MSVTVEFGCGLGTRLRVKAGVSSTYAGHTGIVTELMCNARTKRYLLALDGADDEVAFASYEVERLPPSECAPLDPAPVGTRTFDYRSGGLFDFEYVTGDTVEIIKLRSADGSKQIGTVESATLRGTTHTYEVAYERAKQFCRQHCLAGELERFGPDSPFLPATYPRVIWRGSVCGSTYRVTQTSLTDCLVERLISGKATDEGTWQEQLWDNDWMDDLVLALVFAQAEPKGDE